MKASIECICLKALGIDGSKPIVKVSQKVVARSVSKEQKAGILEDFLTGLFQRQEIADRNNVPKYSVTYYTKNQPGAFRERKVNDSTIAEIHRLFKQGDDVDTIVYKIKRSRSLVYKHTRGLTCN